MTTPLTMSAEREAYIREGVAMLTLEEGNELLAELDATRARLAEAEAAATRLAAGLRAAEFADWQQVALNGGPPCFRVEDDGHFCFRAERWDGHRPGGIHEFVTLRALLAPERAP